MQKSGWIAIMAGSVVIIGCDRGQSPDINQLSATAQICGYVDELNKVTRPGLARDIGADARGNSWVVGTPANGAGYRIYEWIGYDWADRGGGAVRIAVGGGIPWVVNSRGGVYYWRKGSGWEQLPNAPLSADIAVGATQYVVEKYDYTKSGGRVYRRDSDPIWKPVGNARATAISADAEKPWIVAGDGTVQYWDGWRGEWNALPDEFASDIAVVSPNQVYIVSRRRNNHDYFIMKWEDRCWNFVTDSQGNKLSAIRIAGVDRGKIWFTKWDNSIHYASWRP